MKQVSILLLILIASSCIPLRIAPTIKEDKVVLAKKFKRNLPKEYAFIFEDPKDANAFYDYIDVKFVNEYLDPDWDMSFTINNNEYFLTYREVEIPTKTINLIPILIDAHLDSKGYDPILEGAEFTRKGNWYIALTVSDNYMRDCLNPNFKYREQIVQHLRDLRIDYLNSHNYVEVLLRKK